MIVLKPPLGQAKAQTFLGKYRGGQCRLAVFRAKTSAFLTDRNPLLLALSIARAVLFFRCLECLLQTDHILAGP